MSGMDRFYKRQKEKQNSSSVTASKSGMDRYYQKQRYNSMDTSGVDQKYIDSFINDSNAFLTTAEKDYSGLGWGSASSAYESRNQTWQELNKRADTIGAWLYKNRNNIDQEMYANMSNSLEDIRRSGSSVLDAFKNSADYFAQWQSEDEYNKWYEAESDYQKHFENVDAGKASQGWQKYLADEEAAKNAPKYDLNNDGKDSWWETALGYLGGNGGGVTDTTLPTAGVTQTIHDLRADESYKRPSADWSEEQKNAFGALYATSPDLAYAFADQTNNRNAKAKEEEALRKIVESATSSFGAGAGHTLGALVTAPMGLADYLNDLAMVNAGRDIAPDGNISPFEYSQAVIGGIREHLNKEFGTLDDDLWVVGGKGVGDLYGLGTSIAQSMASAYTLGPGGALVSYFGQGAAAGVDEALARGATDSQAALYGTSLGAFEGIAESIGIDNLFKLGTSTTIKGFLKNILKQAGAEGMEEGLTALLSNIADNAIMQDKSNFTFLVAQYMAQGMSESEATTKAWLTTIGDVAFDTIAGAASGGVSGGIHTTAQNIASNIDAKKIYGNGAELVTEAMEIDSTNAYAKKMQAKVDGGKSLSGSQINRLVESNEQTLKAQDKAKMKSAVEARLAELGETGDLGKIADVIVKAQTGGKLTSAERSVLVNSKYGRRVSTELNPQSIESGAYTSKCAENIGTERINVEAYNRDLYHLAEEQAGVSPAAEEGVTPTKYAPTKEIATEVKFEASEAGKTTYNGSEVKIQGVASVENGEVMVQLDNGEVVNARDVEFGNQEEALLYEAIVNMDTDTAKDFIQGFNSMKNAPMTNPQTVSDYMLGFNEARTYGELGIPYEALARDGKYANALIGNQAQIAYNRGKINGISKAKATQEAITSGSTKTTAKQTPRKYKGETHASEIKQSRAYKSLSKLQKAGVDGMVALYKALGIDVYFFESPTDSKGKRKGKNGYFNPEDNSVHIDLYAGIDGRGLIIYTGGHELTHYIRANLPEKFKAFADVLFEQYEAKGISVAGLIASKKHTLEQKGRITPDMTAEEAYDLAYEEVVADACEAMLGNGEAFAQMSEKIKAKDEGLWNAIKKFFTDLVAKIKAAYAEFSPDSFEGQKVAEMLETATDLQRMWVDMLVEASEVHGVSMEVTANDAMTGTDVSDITKKPVQKLQERTEYQEFPKEMIKITSNGAERSPMDIKINGKKFVGSASVRMLRNARFAENKFDPKYVTKVNKMLDKMRDYLAEARVKYTYVGLTDVYNAKIIISPTTGQIVLSGLVNNGDYEINFDFTKTCKKRIALQDVIEQLAREKGRVGEDGVQTEVDLSEENIRHINEVLAANGIETACLCCFVESKRYAMQAHFQEKVCDVWNRLVDEVNAEEDIFKEAPYFNFADSDIETSKIPDEEYDKLYADITRWRNYKFEDAGEGEGAIERKMKAFLINTPAARKKLRLSDFITEAGRTNLHKLYPDIESLAKAKIGTALPKAVESFAPYNGEIELLSVSGKEDLATYVKNIAGARSQSFSDFIMSHVYDVLQKTASLTARKLTAHTYTKEISRARLFGMTGEKTNLSVLHEVDPEVDSWNAGLKEDGSYFVSDYDAFRNGLCNQIQAIPDRESIALQNDPRYSRDCGRIGVGFSYNHMLKMHNDPDIRQVIGYHTSSLPAAIKPLTNLDKATDYTPVQNTLRFKGFKKPNYDIPDGVPSYATPPQDIEAGFKIGKNGQPTKTRMSKYAKSDATFDIKGKYEELSKTMDGVKAAKETLRQLLQFASDNGLALETSKYKNGHADFDLYGDTEATQNPYLSADNYIEYCISRGLVPMFYEFALNDNYYKDIYDFNVFDRLSYNPETGLHEDSADRKAYAPQVPVHMINEDGSMAFPKDFWTLVDKYMNDYNYQREDFANKFPKIMQEVRSIKDSSGKPMISKQGNKYSDRDSLGNTLSDGQVEFFKHSKVRDKKGNLIVLYHGTTANFNTFKKGDVGFHFGTKGAARGRVGFGKNVTLKEVYLNITNPIEFDEDLGSWDADYRLARELYDKGILSKEETESVLLSDDKTYRRSTESANKKLASVLMAKGYDGISYQNTFETKKATTSYIVFNSNQAKEITNKTPTSNPDIRYSDRVTDPETLDFLNEQLENREVTEVYRAMAVDDDGNLFPPMAGYVRKNGKKIINGQPTVIGEWEQSTESIPWDSVDEAFLIENGFKHFETPTKDYPNGRFERDSTIFYRNKAGEWKAKFHLDKDNGTTVDAAYAPYIHTSLSVLNDQFTSAYTRDNLVVVKGYVPNSEINGVDGKRYQANFADKPVGKTKWHSGVVAAQMPETRTVILSRYFMPIEIVDDSVVAQKTKEMMKGNDIEIPYNVITPSQRRAMEAIGIRIGEARGLKDPPKKADVKYSDRDVQKTFGINSINDYVGVQKAVLDTLARKGFFSNGENVVTNRDSGMVVEITKDGIRETLGKANRFQTLPRRLKELKLETIHLLPRLIEAATLVDDNVPNVHNSESKLRYAYLTTDIDAQETDGQVAYTVTITVRKSPQKNKFWMHAIRITKKEQGLSSSGDVNPHQEYNKALALDNIIPQDSEVVKREFSDTAIKYSDRDPNAITNRSLLANALESVAQNDIERNKLAQYKSKLALIESEQAKLAEVKKKANDIRFTKGRTADETKQMKALEFEANQIANRINTYDRQLLNLEATAALKGVLQREKQMAYKKAEQKGKEALAKQRERDAKTQRELLTRYQESRKKGVEGRRKTEMRHKIKNVVNELNQYLLKGTKEKHVPIELQKAVAEALDAVNMDTVSAEERIAKKRDEMMKAKTPEAIERLAKEIATIQEMGSNMDAKLARLKTAYDNIINSDDPLIANSHDDVISNSIDRVAEVIGDTPLRDMSLHQLEAVYDLYKMVLHSIRATNKAFKAEKGEAISTIANGVISELEGKKRKSPYTTKAKEKVSEFDWNNLKPVYAFERVGSANFTKVFNAVRAGEDVWANDMSDAQAFREEQFKKYKYDTWDFKKRYGFTSTSGNHFELTLDQILSLYAFSKRAQAGDHLKYGGFVFDGLTEVKSKNKVGMTVTYQLKDATAYNLSEGTLAEIIEKLTPEQKEFADVMQDYLSTVMGEKGNEVSLALYDIKLFKEKNYFPLKSAPQYLAKAKEQAQGEVKIKNSGFTKETNPKAKNPIVLSSFMDVWAGHVNEMSMYHAFTLPLEDFYRVYNYHTPADEKLQSMSVVSSLENAHGQAAANYIDQLLKDLNGGARSDPRETLGKSLMANFKKSAVMASMSVVVQQPTAIVRAMALVNSRYFLGAKPTKKKHKEAWAEVKKYAPVAVIKEMGYFDTGMGKGSVEWLKGEKTLMDKVDDATSKLPALADEITWVAIWNAVKRETVHTHKHLQPNSDAFLKAVGERFTEVITKTQVYDSTLSRSANMRSKSTFMNMVTSFMAEPTTSINMLQDAFHKGNKKYFARTMGAVYGSVVLNAALVSIVYAMRDDDEDETFLEKYLSRFTTEVVDGANPLTYLPIVKDIWSIAQGFDVERADMSLVTDLFDSFQQTANVLNKDTSDMDDDELEAHKKEVAESILGIMDNFSSLAGIPVKNVRRDINGIINAITTVGTDMDGRETTAGSLGDNILGNLKDSIPVWGWFPDESKGDKLYDAIIKGDSDYIDRLKSGYASEESYHSAVKKIVRERYEDGDISASEAERIIVNHGGESEEDAFTKVQYWGFKRDYPSYDLSEEAVAKYYTDVEPTGIDIDVYYDYYKLKAKCKGVDEDGDGQTDSGSKKAEIMEVIDSLPISDEQKDALYYLNGWSANTIWQAPWH